MEGLFCIQKEHCGLRKIAKYIEGILLAINNLSVDIDDSMKYINIVLDKLLYKHLNTEEEPLHEDALKVLETKDSIPVAKALEYISAVLGRLDNKG